MRNKHQKRNARRRRRERHVYCNQGRSHWGKFGAAGVLIVCDGHVVMAQRSFSLSKRGQWQLPGGALSARWEEPVSGAMRELFEEVSGFNVFDFKLLGYDAVDCECGWAYTTFRVSIDHMPEVYTADWETRRLAWVPISMVRNMNLLSAFRRYWKTHSRMIAAESPYVAHPERFEDQAYDYDLDDDFSQSYYDKKGESRFERTYKSYSSWSSGSYNADGTYRAYGKYGTTYDGASAFTDARTGYQAGGGGASGSTQAQFSDGYGYYPAGSYGTYGPEKYSGDNGFHYSPVDYSDYAVQLPVDYDADWGEPTDADFEQAEIDGEVVDLDDLVEADWETINDSVLDAIDRAMIQVGIG